MRHVVVIGGGYGGLRAIEHLVKKNEEIEITLIDKNHYHFMQTESYGYIAGRFDIMDVALNLEIWCKGFSNRVKFICAHVDMIDFKDNALICGHIQIKYDELIIAVGAKTNFFPFIKGLDKHSFGVKRFERSFELRQSFEKRIEQKLKNSRTQREGDFQIVIGGAGLSGVEIAAEMSYTLKKFKKILGNHSKSIHITLVDAGSTILPGLDPYLIEKSEKRLKSLGVKILTDTFIDVVEERKIYFKDGTSLAYDFMIFTGGIVSNDLTKSLGEKTNNAGQLMVDERLRVGTYENVYAIGDCIELRDAKGEVLPPTAQMAEKAAEYVAHEIKHKLDPDFNPEGFNAKMDGLFIALGGNYAVGILFDKVKVSGSLASLLKKLITRLYRLGLEVKVNAGYRQRGE